MKIAIGIIAILLSFAIGFQSCAVGLGGSLTSDQKTTEAAALGVLVALLFIIGGAFAFAKPKVSRVVFIIAAVCAFAAASSPGSFKDMIFWGVASSIFAVMSHFAMKESGNPAQKIVTVQNTGTLTEMDMAGTKFCVKCGTRNSEDDAFCTKCGAKSA